MNRLLRATFITRLSQITVLLVLILISGCAAIENPMLERSPEWDRRDISRVAFLPVIAEERYTEAADLLQRSLYINLSRMPEFHILEPMAVEEILVENNLLLNNQWQDVPPSELGELLNADILLKSELLRFGAVYAVIQTTAKVGAEIEFIDAETGASLYKTRKGVTSSRGLSGIPTGYGSIVLEPIRGMGMGARKDMVRRLASEIVDSLDPAVIAQEKAKKDEVVEIMPPALEEISAKYDQETRYLDVQVEADPDCRVTFWFGGLAGPYPMQENSPGKYRGGFMFPEETLTVPPELSIRIIREDGAADGQLVEVLKN